ncbi:hypothetical protein C6I20_13600 [Aeromicrobium sp. A1-2]|uniref:hypothetical protein n=1 Tax=Aeromicrobium sp. A1-2 TaxID=2107713 RepID=UPI000E511C66|nr:hypothetical protein [Aeromicrobium sp. A1-2]AXT86120.1 hypothetical protein C6I20_13600 [Aeromicrobium sp. A1-2]
MKFLVIIVVIAAVVAVLWLRTVRQGATTTQHPRSIDDTVRPAPGGEIRLDAPSTGIGTPFGDAAQESAAAPGSDFAWEPEVADPDGDATGRGPQTPRTHPTE